MEKYFKHIAIGILIITCSAFLFMVNFANKQEASPKIDLLGSSITSLQQTMTGSTSMAIINSNFANLNNTKLENSDFTGGEGITYAATGTISFDCSEVEGTGINCSGEDITLDATGDWTGTLDGYEGADFFTLSDWYSTTTDQLDEGSNNLYFTNGRVYTIIGATTSLPNLNITESQISDLGIYLTAESDPVWLASSSDYYTASEIDGMSFSGSISQLGQIGDVSTTTLAAGYVLKYSGTEWESVATSALGIIGAGGGSGTVTSVAMTVPTGLSISGSPITDSGTLALTFTGGYNIPLTASTTNWNTAYNWGDHSGEGYLVSADINTLAELNALMGETIASTTASNSTFINDAGYLTSASAGLLYDVLGQATSTLASHTTTYNHANHDTAYGWGNHAGLYDVVGQATSTLTSHTSTYNHANYDTAYGWGYHGEAGYLLQAYASSTYMQDTDIDTFSELNSWVTDATLLKSGGTLTESKYCTWDGAGIDCNSEGGSGGGATDYLSQIADVSTTTLADGYILKWNATASEWQSTSTLNTFKYEKATSTAGQTVFDLSSMTYDTGDNELEVFVNGVYQVITDSYAETDSDTVTFDTGLNAGDVVVFAVRGGIVDAGSGTQLTEEEVEDYVGGMVTGNTETLITVTYQDADGTIDFVVDEASINHDSLTGFVANEHIDWTSDQGATNIHSGNYTDTNTTYTAGDFLTLTGTDFDVDTAAVTNGDTTHLSTADAIYDWGVGAFQPLESTLTDIADGTINENLVNTAYPWTDDEVADNITASNYLALTAWYSTTTDQLTEGSINLYQDSELTNWIDDVVLGASGALTLPSGQNFTIGVIQWNSGDYIDGENIKDDTIDNDSIDWADMTDLTTDGAVSWGNMLWTEIDSYPDACASGVVTGIGDTLTCTDTYMQDEDINTIAELNSWVTDATLLISGGTLTSGKICRYDGTGIDCDYTDQTGGGGGSSVWATSTGLYYNNEGNQFLIGDSSTSSDSILEVKGAITTDGLTVDDGTTSATSTLELGAETNISCLKMRDTDRDGWTYITVLNGVLYVSTTSCEE